MRLAPIAALCLSPVTSAAQSVLTAEEAAVLQEGLVITADALILPAYTAQAEATQRLTDTLGPYCAGEGEIDPAHAAFADTFLAWQRASLIQVGPITEAEGPMRVQLWPDPKGFGQRAIRMAIRQEDPALLADGGLEGRSIALTNLTALEYLLHDDLVPDSYGCELALAIARFQADLAADLVTAWTPGSAYRDLFDTAAPGNALYPSVDVLLRELLAGGVVYTDRLRKFKLERGLGEEPGEARPERSEARLSGLGLDSIEVSFRALSEFFEVPFGLFDAAPMIGGTMDYYILAQTTTNIADALSLEDRTLSDVLAEDGARADELRNYAELIGLQEAFLKTGFTRPLGLITGFTAADGD